MLRSCVAALRAVPARPGQRNSVAEQLFGDLARGLPDQLTGPGTARALAAPRHGDRRHRPQRPEHGCGGRTDPGGTRRARTHDDPTASASRRQTEEAFTFYKSVFGTEFTGGIMRHGDVPTAVNAVKRGAKLVVADPRRTELARHASHVLQFKADTDVALFNGILQLMIENDWIDHDFVAVAFNSLGYTRPNGEILAYYLIDQRAKHKGMKFTESAALFWHTLSMHIHRAHARNILKRLRDISYAKTPPRR